MTQEAKRESWGLERRKEEVQSGERKTEALLLVQTIGVDAAGLPVGLVSCQRC
jgi:hypothetical protein